MKTTLTGSRLLFTGLLAAVSALTGLTHAQTIVRELPHFSPNGSVSFPFSNVATGIWAVANNGEVRFSGGTFSESATITKPMLLTSPTAVTTIGPFAPTRTTFTLVSYNTHLFGQDIIPGLPRWKDSERAVFIAQTAALEDTDVFAFQEVWDPDLFTVIRNNSGYSSGFYGGAREGSSQLNSGLFTMSRLTLTSPAQVFYAAENGVIESLSSKGYVRTTCVKNGFTITMFNTHTQSGDTTGDSDARQQQLTQLAVDIATWRFLHPTHIVLVNGDVNVVGEGSEFYGAMQTALGNTAKLADGATNRPTAGNAFGCTSCSSNDLKEHFSGDTDNSRLDYILYVNSLDGQNRVLPISYAVKYFQIPQPFPPLSGSGLTTRDLSDHWGLKMVFELQRN